MSQQTAQAFIAALHTLEETSDPEPLAALHTDSAAVGNVLAPDQFSGPDGARKFWKEYRGTFQSLHSEFRNIITTDDRAALEWTTQGTAFDGKPFTYSGVSLLEIDGEKITRFAAYFDPAALGHQIGPSS